MLIADNGRNKNPERKEARLEEKCIKNISRGKKIALACQ